MVTACEAGPDEDPDGAAFAAGAGFAEGGGVDLRGTGSSGIETRDFARGGSGVALVGAAFAGAAFSAPRVSGASSGAFVITYRVLVAGSIAR
jgi:hypothetical protein